MEKTFSHWESPIDCMLPIHLATCKNRDLHCAWVPKCPKLQHSQPSSMPAGVTFASGDLHDLCNTSKFSLTFVARFLTVSTPVSSSITMKLSARILADFRHDPGQDDGVNPEIRFLGTGLAAAKAPCGVFGVSDPSTRRHAPLSHVLDLFL